MGFLSAEVLFFFAVCVCGEQQKKKAQTPIQDVRAWYPSVEFRKCLAVSGVQNSADLKAIEKKVTE